jgi:ribonuclease-3
MARRASKRAAAKDAQPAADRLESAQLAATEELERVLGHSFRRPDLLTLALTHRSYVYDAGGSEELADRAHPARDNEQLEFVGDAALGLLAAESLCARFPASREGELTQLRASVVSRRHLGEVGARMGLGRWLRLGHTAEKNAGRTNTALFANAVEALIAALYLDGGIEVARRFVEEQVLAGALPELKAADGEPGSIAIAGTMSGAVGDHKSALQEWLQATGLGRPQYRLLGESGPDHRRVFRVEVRLEDEALAEAEGSTKKQAQQEAARLAMARLMVAETEAAHG